MVEETPQTPDPNADQAKTNAEDAEKRADDAIDAVDKLGEPIPEPVSQLPAWSGANQPTQ